MLIVTDKPAPQTRPQPREHAQSLDDDDDDEEEMEQDRPEEVMMAEQVGEFDEVVVWGHGGTVDGESDMFVRGVREWVGFAESMHCDEEEGDGVEAKAATAS
jgi:ribonuclease H2 subunit C